MWLYCRFHIWRNLPLMTSHTSNGGKNRSQYTILAHAWHVMWKQLTVISLSTEMSSYCKIRTSLTACVRCYMWMSLLPYWTLRVYYVVNWSYGCVSVSSFWEMTSNVSWLTLLLLGPTCKVGQGRASHGSQDWEGRGEVIQCNCFQALLCVFSKCERSHAYRRLLSWKTVSLGR